MRQVQHGRKQRGRGRKQHNPLSRIYDSSGPETKIRGTAAHIAEKYQSLARDATSSGHRIVAENYLQHAEHYLRIVAVAQAAMQPAQLNPGQANSNHDNANRGDQAPASERREAGDNNAGDTAQSGENPQGSRGEPDSQSSGRNRRGQRRRQPASDQAGSTPTIDNAEKQDAGEVEPAPISTGDDPEKPIAAEADSVEDKAVNGALKSDDETKSPTPRRRTRRKPKVADEGKDSDIAADAGTAEIA